MIHSDKHESREQMINHFIIALLISRAVSVWRMFWKQTLTIICWFQASNGPSKAVVLSIDL